MHCNPSLRGSPSLVVAGVTIAEKKPEEQADRTGSFAAKEWQKALVEAQAYMVHSLQKSRSRTMLLVRVDGQLLPFQDSYKLKLHREESVFLANEQQKLVSEKI
jgi:hypothetical protein